ncbi:hypothetical protein Lser_V15G20188 [Lactuca serriola]
MNQTKLILLILTLTFTIYLQCVECRHLKSITHHTQTIVKGGVHNTAAYANANANEALLTKPTSPPSDQTLVASQLLVPPPPHAIEDFRPTTPGHSPGAGHSIHD